MGGIPPIVKPVSSRASFADRAAHVGLAGDRGQARQVDAVGPGDEAQDRLERARRPPGRRTRATSRSARARHRRPRRRRWPCASTRRTPGRRGSRPSGRRRRRRAGSGPDTRGRARRRVYMRLARGPGRSAVGSRPWIPERRGMSWSSRPATSRNGRRSTRRGRAGTPGSMPSSRRTAAWPTPMRSGSRPTRIVGDLDSADPARVAASEAAGVRIVRAPAAKDESDTELAILEAVRLGATRVTVLGALGGPRLDHALANVWLLALPALATIDVQLLDDRARVSMLTAPGADGRPVRRALGRPDRLDGHAAAVRRGRGGRDDVEPAVSAPRRAAAHRSRARAVERRIRPRTRPSRFAAAGS